MESSLNVTEQDREYMREAFRYMRQAGLIDKTGGPFGAVIVQDGKVIGAGGNTVIRDSDPTAHAEINAIRAACRALHTVNLARAILYTSCECCPMCYAAAYWARITKIFYGASWTDYNDIFDDSQICQDSTKPYPQRLLMPQQILRDEAQKICTEFRAMPDGARY